MKIGVIGNGFVGKSTLLLENENVSVLCYDTNPNLCKPNGTSLEDLLKCDIIFISVPTPMNDDGSVCISIVESVVSQIKYLKYEGFIVVRSTIIPGTSDKLNVYFMPEFLTEKNFQNDFINNPLWIFGLLNNHNDELFKKKIHELFDICHKYKCIKSSEIEWMSNKEAEMVKYFRNTFLSVKVSFCNEIYEYCKLKNIDYEKVRSVAANDERIKLSHTQVPGHDGKRGFGGTCFPKDTNALLADMNKNKMNSYVIKSVIERNELVDRPEKDWSLDKGRAVV